LKINNTYSKPQIKNNIKYLFLILSILFCFYLIIKSNLYPNDYAYTEWFINYEGEFIKRGLSGQIVFDISKLFKLDLKFSILLIQILGCLTYFYFFYLFTKKININFFWYLAIFAPLLLMYPIFELEALGRKDVLVISCFLIFLNMHISRLANLDEMIGVYPSDLDITIDSGSIS